MTQKGTRAGKLHNEDSMAQFVCPFGDVLIIADGMGGHGHGDMASNIVVGAFRETMLASASLGLQEAMRYSLQIAHARIIQAVDENGLSRGVGSTVVLAVIQGDTAYIGHVGDSRCYLYHENELYQLTRDHSLVQGEIDAGRLSEEQALLDARASTLTRAVGATENVELEFHEPVILSDGDALLLCSDGIHGYVDRIGILYGLRKNARDAQRVTEALVAMAASTCNSDDDISIFFAQYGAPKDYKPAPVFMPGRSEELQARLGAGAPTPNVPSAANSEARQSAMVPTPPGSTLGLQRPPKPQENEGCEPDTAIKKNRFWLIVLCVLGGVIVGMAGMQGYERLRRPTVKPPVAQPHEGKSATEKGDTKKPQEKSEVPAAPPSANKPVRVGVVARGTSNMDLKRKLGAIRGEVLDLLKKHKGNGPMELIFLNDEETQKGNGAAAPGKLEIMLQNQADSTELQNDAISLPQDWQNALKQPRSWDQKYHNLDVVIFLPTTAAEAGGTSNPPAANQGADKAEKKLDKAAVQKKKP
jgi:serine/threonine protein phosphatase PrpC